MFYKLKCWLIKKKLVHGSCCWFGHTLTFPVIVDKRNVKKAVRIMSLKFRREVQIQGLA